MIKEGSPEKKIKVLIADDNPFVRTSVIYPLTHEGYTIIEAEDGVQAVEMTEKERPDIILMDLAMPRMNGFEATIEIRKKEYGPKIPIIMITAHATKEHVLNGKKIGINRFVVKPFDIDDLMKLINDSLSENSRLV